MNGMLRRTGLWAAWLFFALAGPAFGFTLFSSAPTLPVTVKAVFPHDRAAFTQGLLFADGVFYESDGLYGRSRLAKIDPQTGRILQKIDLPREYFGEGLALADGRLYQLTWRKHKVFVYDKDSFALVGELTLPTEGWGAAFDGKRLIISDGSSVLRFYEPADLRETGRIVVTDGGKPLDNLNELEWVEGNVLANVWGSDLVARIDPATGKVLAWYDLSVLRAGLGPLSGDAVLNGLAYDESGKRLYATGKFWPKLFEIELAGVLP